MPDDVTGTEGMEFDANNGAARVGAGLREVRERLGWKLPDVAEALRIRPEFLEAIEAGDLTSLPGPAYRAGFVRSYAQILGLDGEEILRRFREAGQMGEIAKSEIQFLAPVPDRGVPTGVVILLGVLVVLAGYGFWYFHTEQQRKLAQDVPQVPTELQPLATPPKVTDPVSASPPPGQAAAPKPASAPSLPAPIAAPASSPAQAATTAPTASPAAQSPALATPPADATAAPGSPSPAAPASSPAAAQPATSGAAAGLSITATQDAWVQVTDATGNILFSKVLHPGDSWPVPQEPGLKLTTGNAGGTIITNNGQQGAPLGAQGVVLHGYQLTPAGPATPTSPAPGAPTPATGAAQ